LSDVLLKKRLSPHIYSSNQQHKGKNMKSLKSSLFGLTIAVLALVAPFIHAADISLLNVSYDPTREFYKEYNQAFAKHWKEKKGDNITFVNPMVVQVHKPEV